MAKDVVVEIPETELLQQPAARAWRRVAPEFRKPARITILKETRHSAVYRLHAAGPEGRSVVAKRCKPSAAAMERAIYEDILPALDVRAIRLYGLLREEDGDGQQSWLFLEDAGNEKYSVLLAEHRVLAGRWLGAMHRAAACLPVSNYLPNRGPTYYLRELQSSREAIRQSVDHVVLTTDHLTTLQAILRLYDVLESHWSEVVRCCDGMPQTLVHGDLAAKNARIGAAQRGINLLIMDWAGAAWGVPAIDLAQFTAQSLSPDPFAYSSAVGPSWPDAGSLAKLAELGKIFRLIVATSWETQSLPGEWLERPMRNIKLYQAAMADCIREAGWED